MNFGRSSTLNSMALSACLLTLALAGSYTLAQPGRPAGGGNDAVPPPGPSDRPEPFLPRTPRAPADEDRLAALTLFSSARSRELNGDLPGALRLYQRALRHDPDSLPLLRQIVPLAARLKRHDEAVTYAVRAAELDPTNSLLLRQLGAELSGRNQNEKALRLFEQALRLEEEGPKRPDRFLLLLEIGRLRFLIGDFPGAADALGPVAEAIGAPDVHNLPDDVRRILLGQPDGTWEFLGEVFLTAERFDAALDAFEKAGTSDPGGGSIGFRRAQVHAARKEWDKAAGELNRYFDAKSMTHGLEPYELLEKILDGQGALGDLIDRLRQLASADGENELLAFFLAEKLRGLGRFDEAEPLYEQVLAESPSADVYTGWIAALRASKKLDRLLHALGEFVTRTTDFSLLGEEYKAILADRPVCDALLAAARKREEDPVAPPGPAWAAGLIAADLKEWGQADDFFNGALDPSTENDAALLMSWGLACLEGEQWQRAVGVFQRAVDADTGGPGSASFRYFLAGALEMDGQTDLALEAARQAASKSDDNPRIASRVGWILYHAKRYEEALAEYQALIDRYSPQVEVDEVQEAVRDARLVMSSIYAVQKRFPEAEEVLQQILDEDPEDVSALNDLGYLWADQGKHLETALDMIQRAVTAEPENTAYLDSLGWVYFRLGRHQEALEPILKASQLATPDGVILDHLGDAYFALGREEEARDAWTRALEALKNDGDQERQDKIDEKLKPKE
jgi:tetratricopeptide (TPR) repeat protein